VTRFLPAPLVVALAAIILASQLMVTCTRDVIVLISVLLYITQETVGLPGLPQNWFEPSRLISLAIETTFLFLAQRQLTAARR
jgi:hypothetical protein